MRLLFLLFILISIEGFSQPSNYIRRITRERLIAQMPDSTFHHPAGSTASLRTGGATRQGASFYDSTGVDSGFYVYGAGGVWQRLARASEAGGSSVISSLTAAAATNTINNAAYAQEWQWNTLAAQTGLYLSSTSTAAASNTSTLFKIGRSGANSNASQTVYGQSTSVTNTGTTNTNVAGYFQATGAATANYALDLLGDIRLNGATEIEAGGFNVSFSGVGIYGLSGVQGIESFTTQSTWQRSGFGILNGIFLGDSIIIRPHLGVINIDSLRNWANTSIADTVNKKPITFDVRNGRIEYSNWHGAGSGVTTMAAIGSSPNANGASISGVTLTLQPANGSFGGVVTTGTQTFAGSKTFSNQAIFTSVSITNDIQDIDYIQFDEIVAPGTPASGKGFLYEKTDGKIYFKNDGGTEYDLTGGGGGGDVFKVGTPANNQVGVWTGDGTIEGDANFTWTGAILSLTPSADNVNTVQINRNNGNKAIQMGTFPSAPTYGTIWFGNVTASDVNYSIYGDNNELNFHAIAAMQHRINGANIITVVPGGVSIKTTSNSAYLMLGAGTASANTAPLKFTSGTNLTTAETGAMEYNGTNLFFTRTGTTRESIITANAVNSVSPTSPNRTITVVIDGTTYYLAAKTTND
jgi:hypothetical protein